jgi:hypothetical protein
MASSTFANRPWKRTLEAEVRTSLGSWRFVRGVFAGVGSMFVLVPFVPVPNKLSFVMRVLSMSSSDDIGDSRRVFRTCVTAAGRFDSFVGVPGTRLVGDSGEIGEECLWAATRLDRLGVNGVQPSSFEPHRGAGGVWTLTRDVDGGVFISLLPSSQTQPELDQVLRIKHDNDWIK